MPIDKRGTLKSFPHDILHWLTTLPLNSKPRTKPFGLEFWEASTTSTPLSILAHPQLFRPLPKHFLFLRITPGSVLEMGPILPFGLIAGLKREHLWQACFSPLTTNSLSGTVGSTMSGTLALSPSFFLATSNALSTARLVLSMLTLWIASSGNLLLWVNCPTPQLILLLNHSLI